MERARRIQHEQQLSELRRERERSERLPAIPVELHPRRRSLVDALAELVLEMLS
jgi:hypothetical protein